MGNKINILLADDNIEFGNLLHDYLNRTDDINVAGVARDGIEALDMIESLSPDIVVLDVIMPNLDGIGVLEKIAAKALKDKPQFLMLSAIGQDVFVQKAISLGAEYYVVKPFDADVLLSRIREIYREKNLSAFSNNKASVKPLPQNNGNTKTSNSVEIEVTNLMRDIGIPPHMAGYQYIREAIIQTLGEQKIFGSITKSLYPAVAAKFNTSAQKVERGIRNAIESAWARGNPDSIDSLFGFTISYTRGKPTNSEFIAMMADRIRISMGLK